MNFTRYIAESDHEKTVWMDWNWNIHREDNLPAIEYKDGTLIWYQNGVKHREGNMPAVVFQDGHKEYWKNGKLHREDGPAIIKSDGVEFYYRDGAEYHPNSN